MKCAHKHILPLGNGRWMCLNCLWTYSKITPPPKRARLVAKAEADPAGIWADLLAEHDRRTA